MASITVNYIKENEVLPHPLVIIDGTITNFASLGLATQQWFITARVDFQTGLSWPIVASGGFKAMVQVSSPGKYTVMLKAGSVSRAIPIECKPVATANVVRFNYQKSSDALDNEGFDAPEDVNNSDDAALQRIRFNALLMQATTAEMFVNAGQPCNTFAMEFASDGLPVARLLRSSFTNATARTINDQELYKLADQDIVSQGLNSDPQLQFKHAVILSCAKYNTSTQKAEGHTTLGGGKMGIFGSCGLHTGKDYIRVKKGLNVSLVKRRMKSECIQSTSDGYMSVELIDEYAGCMSSH